MIIQDMKYALRWFRKNPGFAALAIVTLALGIGVNTAMFSVVNAVILQPLPFSEADRIVWMAETGPEIKDRWISYPNFRDWRTRNQSFEAMSTFRGWSMNLTGTGEPENLDARMVGADYFKVMRTTPLLGRDFTEQDDQPGAAAVTILSYPFWQKRFAGDPNIVGKDIVLDDNPYTVIGVMPESFSHQGPPPLWVLIGPQNWNRGGENGRDVRIAGFVVARLKPGVTLQQARADMNRISRELLQAHPIANAGANAVTVVSLQQNITRNVDTALKILFAAVALVLLIACANVANLLLARAAARRKEFAVRAALGASRRRIIRQLLVESLMLSLAGGALGLLFASWAMLLFARVASETVPRLTDLSLNREVFAFNLVASVVTGILFGLAPALKLSKTQLQETLKDNSATTSERHGKRMRGTLVVVEVAFSVTLLVGAGLLVKSMFRLLRSENGFNPNGLLTMDVKISRGRFPNREELSGVLHRLLESAQAVPGVEHAAISTNLPGFKDGWTNDIAVEGYQTLKGELIEVDWAIVSADYFKTMQVPILHGRTFTEDEDRQGKPVVLVDESLARRFWPNESAVGKHIKYDSATPHEIIGVVKQVGFYGLEEKPLIKIYTPMGRFPQRTMTLSIRSATTDAQALTSSVRHALQATEKDVPVTEVATLNEILAREAAPRRFNAALFSVFAALALLLAGTGVYGVIAYSVARRTHEVGIRMALGAQRHDVLGLFISDGMRLVLLGLVLGLGGAFALTRVMSSLLFGVKATDLTTFAVVAISLLGVGLLACYLPARRATKVDPLVALRYE
jgi:putative ABC transport system permease protein